MEEYPTYEQDFTDLKHSQSGPMLSEKKLHGVKRHDKRETIRHLLATDLSKKTSVHVERKPEHITALITALNTISPLIYLNKHQREEYINNALFTVFTSDAFLNKSKTHDPNDEGSAYILLSGEMHILCDEDHFVDLIDKTHFFGYDGPIFNKRSNKTLIIKDSLLAEIPKDVFLRSIVPFSKFANFISQRIIRRDGVLDRLNVFKNFILNSPKSQPIDVKQMIKLYKNIDSCLHPTSNSKELDISSWTYALERLPASLIETYVYILLNTPSKILYLSQDEKSQILPMVKSTARNRDIFQYLSGKNVIIVRDTETDVLDFMSNMCIHIIESKKIRKLVSSPIIIDKLLDSRGNFQETMEVFEKSTGVKVNEFSTKTLKKIFGDEFGDKLLNICLHRQDYSLSIKKMINNDQSAEEKWVQNLWSVARDLLEITTCIEELDDLVVDIFQGSKRTLLGCLSPHMYKNKEEILKWAHENNIKLKTPVFLCDTDKLIAYSFYYYEAHPEKQKEKEEMEKAHGVVKIVETFSTGVQILLINTNKLDPNYCDPSFKIKPASKNHIILHIGYTFGAQSGHIIKPLLMLFGSKARSMNIIGKAGGLAGDRTDILCANKIFYDKTHELANVNCGHLDVPELESMTMSPVHLGPMLTVAGTILQNTDLLLFYKNVMGCVGIEMEGYFFVREIESSIKHGVLDQDFVTRCFYYASDIPLDPDQNLAKESGNVCWDEGICSMNAIQRYIFKEIFN